MSVVAEHGSGMTVFAYLCFACAEVYQHLDCFLLETEQPQSSGSSKAWAITK